VTFVACEHVLGPNGWLSPAVLELDEQGTIVAISSGSAPGDASRVDGFVIPGMPNLHSHAFQRAIVGLTENVLRDQRDSFWTWRERMYEVAALLEPEDLEAIAAQLYVEMLEAGFTAVGEFHYVHRDRNGAPYADPAEMSRRIVAAADTSGIALTHLPVLYMQGGFARAPSARQRRFLAQTVDEHLELVRRIATELAPRPRHRVGIAPHSLRAVGPAELKDAIAGARAIDPELRIHIHIAEQEQEVSECIAHLGARPVRWLLDAHAVDARWCLVHATQIDDGERRALAASHAIAGLCPTTEANLGDGIFPAAEYLADRGAFGVGTDSHASTTVSEELRLLEYGQRLVKKQRNVLAAGADARVHVGRALYERAALGGATALAQPAGSLAPGMRADLVVLDREHPRLYGHRAETALDAWIFGAAEGAVRDVMVAGRWLVRDRRHIAREHVEARYRIAIDRLRST
jgi:formimidoylglutamate deiminase